MSHDQTPYPPPPNYRPPVSVLAPPPTRTITSSSNGSPSVITTELPHYYWKGDSVKIDGHSTALVNGTHVVTEVTSPTTFAIDVGGAAGTGGTVTLRSPAEVLTLDQAKLRAGLDWVSPDPRDQMMQTFITSARRQVEQDTTLALRLQVRDVYVDDLTNGLGWPSGPHWPSSCLPLAAVLSVSWMDSTGTLTPVDPSVYEVDTVTGRVALRSGQSWPTSTTMKGLSPWVLRIVAGYLTPDEIPVELVDAIGLLTAHKATMGRDLATASAAVVVPMGYAEAIAPYRPEVLA